MMDESTRPGHDPRRDTLEREDYAKDVEDKRVVRDLKKLRPRRPSVGPAATQRRQDR